LPKAMPQAIKEQVRKVRTDNTTEGVGTLESRDLPDRTLAPDREPSTEPAQALPRVAKKAKLEEVERQLASNGDSIPLLLRRGGLLSDLGHFEKAAHGYLRVLERDPNNPTALNNVACVLVSMGKLTAARTVYQETVRRHPGNATCRVNLGNVLMEESERLTAYQKTEQVLQLRREAREQYEEALRLTPDCERAHEGLFYALRALGETAEADQHRRKAFEKRYIIPCAYRGDKTPVRVLQLMSTNGGNVRLQPFLDERIFQRFKVLPEFYKGGTPLPTHHLVVNAIGDAELSSQALIDAQSVLEHTRAPIINAPGAVLATARVNNARRLSCVPGAATPITTMLTREQLSGSEASKTIESNGISYPFLLRAPGFHTGLNFARIETAEALPRALAELPGEEFIAMQYLDARGEDGKHRKYRAMLIDGKIYPLHLAVSSQWKVHYFTADMADDPEHRSEDEVFLEDMPNAIGPLAMKALERIQAILGLDYAGVDFGLNAKRELLLFEANATMAVLKPDADPRWNYRRDAYERIFAAVQNMFLKKASATAAGAHCG
jgi:hypothetical protein